MKPLILVLAALLSSSAYAGFNLDFSRRAEDLARRAVGAAQEKLEGGDAAYSIGASEPGVELLSALDQLAASSQVPGLNQLITELGSQVASVIANGALSLEELKSGQFEVVPGVTYSVGKQFSAVVLRRKVVKRSFSFFKRRPLYSRTNAILFFKDPLLTEVYSRYETGFTYADSTDRLFRAADGSISLTLK